MVNVMKSEGRKEPHMIEQEKNAPACIMDPNRKERTGAPYLAIIFCIAGVAIAFFDHSYLPVSVAIIAAGIICSILIMENWPYTVLTPEGILVRFLFRRQFYRWQEIPQVGIPRGTAASARVAYKYPVVVVCPNGYPRRLDNDKFFLDRNLFRAVILPNRPEIRSFINKYYGPFDFDDTEKLNSWEKHYYGFDKS